MKVTLIFDSSGEDNAQDDPNGGYIFRNGPAAVFVAEMTASLACAYGDQSIVAGPGPDEMADLVADTICRDRCAPMGPSPT